MPTYAFPTSLQLREIEQELLPTLEADRDIFQFFPVEEEDADNIAWELWDNFKGLLQARGMNGEPPRVKPLGAKRYMMPPGVYGEFSLLEEAELSRRAQLGQFTDLVNVEDLVGRHQDFLLQRDLDRRELMGWTLLTSGTFSVPGPSGAVVHTDTYAVQTFTATVAWATSATATPLADLRSVQLLGRGKGVSFGADATAYMNRVTWNRAISNTNNADLYGRRQAGFGTFNNLTSVNELLTGDDLPKVVINDRGYLNDAGTFTPFIPDGKVVVVGKRPGTRQVGSFKMLRNVNDLDDMVGPYTRVIDRGESQIPRRIEVHRGWTGGICIYYPSAIVTMNV